MSNESDNARLGRALMGAVIGFVVLAAIPGVTYGPGANPLLGFVTGAIGAFIGFILGAATEAAEKTDSSLSWMKVGQRFTVTVVKQTPDGNGLAFKAGKTVIVKGGKPGGTYVVEVIETTRDCILTKAIIRL